MLAGYRWPGNVREMAAVIDRAVLIGQGRTLSVVAALGSAARRGRATARPGGRSRAWRAPSSRSTR